MRKSARAAGGWGRGRWARSRLRWGLAAAIASAGVALGSSAQAVITVPEPENNREESRPDQFEFQISRTDCQKDVHFTFRPTGTLSSFEVWTSERRDCSLKTERDTPTGSTDLCRRIAAGLVSDEVTISSRVLLDGLEDIDAINCTDTLKSDSPRQIGIYFVNIGVTGTGNGGSADGGLPKGAGDDNYTWVRTSVDLVPPDPPENIKSAPGDRILIIEFSKPAASDPYSYTFFCAPQAAGDAGGACALPDLKPDEFPTHRGECGDFKQIAGETTLKKLTNGTPFAVAISSVDEAGNIGLPSAPICDTPVPTEDFFEAYKEAGGQASGGCGLCSAGGDSRSGFRALAGAALAFAVFGGRRWRRRAQSRRSPEAE